MKKRRKHLFAYGSLMFDEVLNQIISGRYQKTLARLDGYVSLQVKGEVYPGLVSRPLATTKGIIIHDITERDLKALDDFEGEYYQRIQVAAIAEGVREMVEVYLFKDRYAHLLSNQPWVADVFREKVLRRFADVKSYGVYDQG